MEYQYPNTMVRISNSKDEFRVGYQENEAFPWWVKCETCDHRHSVKSLDFCWMECESCKCEIVNPLHEPFHKDRECHAPIIANDSDYEPSDTDEDDGTGSLDPDEDEEK